MSTSPFVDKLLFDIAARDVEDQRSLHAIAIGTLHRNPDTYDLLDHPMGELCVMSLSGVGHFLRASRFEDWHQSTWLSLSARGSITGDMPANKASAQSDKSMFNLVGSALRQACSTGVAVYVRKEGQKSYGFTSANLVNFLQLARSTARASRDWPSPQALTEETSQLRRSLS